MLPKIEVDNSQCLGPLDCGECLRTCPMTVFIAGPTKKWKFRETDSKEYELYARYYDQCIVCQKCVDVCPAECIAVTFGEKVEKTEEFEGEEAAAPAE